MSKPFRYPGPRPFSMDQQGVFFGRTKEIEELERLILLEPMVVLFAKSGMGKSSLLNAGVAPRIAKSGRLQPVFVRFGAHSGDSHETPLSLTNGKLGGSSDLLDRIRPEGDNSLWYHLKSLQLASLGNLKKGFLLVFDQFEELFTYRQQDVSAFARELSELSHSTIPDRYRAVMEQRSGQSREAFLSDEELKMLHEPFILHVVMAIRSDRLSLLNRLKSFLPNLLDNCYELKALSLPQAEDAVLSPAYDPGDFATHRFDFEDVALAGLLHFLSAGYLQDIESFQLQILCEHLEKSVVWRQKRKLVLTSDIAEPESILENYYLDKIEAIADEKDRLAARKLIEEGLVFEEEERRLALYEGQILKTYGVGDELLHQLLDTHLLRSEPSMRGGYTYELSHDTLVAPVLKAKSRRLEVEYRLHEQIEQRRKDNELADFRRKAAEERRRAEEERRLKELALQAERRAKRISLLANAMSVLMIGLAIWTWQSSKAAKTAKQEAETMGFRFKNEAKASDSLRMEAKKSLDETIQLSEDLAASLNKTNMALERSEEADRKRLLEEEKRKSFEFTKLFNEALTYREAEEFGLAKAKLEAADKLIPHQAAVDSMMLVCESGLIQQNQ